ncbi:MAG: hypothetical protein H7A51_10915 [Akkermansiaceae bacterium]|nr:hypothetical protein [Akkermansiaceae bacterium]
MTTSNKFITGLHAYSALAALAIAACALTSSMTEVSGDTIELSNGDTLTGTIQSLDQGLVVLRSPLAHTPLEIKAESISKMAFSKQEGGNPVHTERLTLANNDVIPCQVLSMDEKQLHITTWFAGEFSIPRNNIRALQFGLTKEQTVFVGKKAVDSWSKHDGNWTFSGKTYSSDSTGTLAEKLDLPENVKFSFNLAWKETPNFAFRFCAANDSPTTKQDTYELLFNSAGMQIRRYENASQPAAPIANLSIKPTSISDQNINIDLRVNRTEGLVSLYVDSKLIGTWPDPFARSKGSYIIFNNRTSRKGGCMISDITVTALNDGSLPRHREKAAPVQTDVLIDSEGEKMSGTIASISQAEADHRMVVLDVKHADKPLRVPDRRISSLLFAQAEDAPVFAKSTFTAIVDGGGQLQLENPKLVDGKLISNHPILGPCTLSPKALSYISQSSAAPNGKNGKTSK